MLPPQSLVPGWTGTPHTSDWLHHCIAHQHSSQLECKLRARQVMVTGQRQQCQISSSQALLTIRTPSPVLNIYTYMSGWDSRLHSHNKGPTVLCDNEVPLTRYYIYRVHIWRCPFVGPAHLCTWEVCHSTVQSLDTLLSHWPARWTGSSRCHRCTPQGHRRGIWSLSFGCCQGNLGLHMRLPTGRTCTSTAGH